MTESPWQVIDLTGETGPLHGVEVHTPAGIIRVSTGLVSPRTGQPAVGVEIEPNTQYRARTAPGGHWQAEVRDCWPVSRLDIALTKCEEEDGS